MHVAEVTAFGAPEVLQLAERPDPAPAPDEVVVRIRAANVNPTDLAVRSGQARQRDARRAAADRAGWDLAGEVTAVGSEAHGFEPGDRVLGMIPFGRIGGRVGAYAQAAAVDPGWLAPISTDLDDATAATLPLNALTARQALDMIDAPAGRDPARHRRERGGRRLRHAARGPRGTPRAGPGLPRRRGLGRLAGRDRGPRARDRPRDHRHRRRRPRRRAARARRHRRAARRRDRRLHPPAAAGRAAARHPLRDGARAVRTPSNCARWPPTSRPAGCTRASPRCSRSTRPPAPTRSTRPAACAGRSLLAP